MDIYSHVSLDLQKEAALKLEQGLKRHKANGKPTLFEPVADQGWITWRLGDLEKAQVVQQGYSLISVARLIALEQGVGVVAGPGQLRAVTGLVSERESSQ